jgi:hypothetical protein
MPPGVQSKHMPGGRITMENNMKLKTFAVAAALAIGATFAPQMASAASLPASGSYQSAVPASSMLQEVGHRHWHRPHFNRCRMARHICADRFGWGTWRFYRCVENRGCARW